MTAEFHPFTAPYRVFIAPSGTPEFNPDTLTATPQAPWVALEDGDIAQNPVKIMWDREMTEEDPAQNDSFSEAVYVNKRSIAVQFSMKNTSVEAIASFLDNADVTKVNADASTLGSEYFDFDEADPYYWAICVLGMGQLVPNGTKMPRILNLAHAYYDGSVEYESGRTQAAMLDVTYRGLKHPTSKQISRYRRITSDTTS